MRWSWKIGEWAGIGVYLHATFVMLIGFLVISNLIAGVSLGGLVNGVGFILVLFACVLLHEFGHALAARRYGIPTRDITLLPIGGLARLEKMPDKPRQELVVALAGPLVNVVIAAVLFVALLVTNGLGLLANLTVTQGSFLERLLVVNVMLVLFNLIPAFPMDGGRVLRSALAMRMDYARATRTAATLGQGFAFVFGIIGFFTNPLLMFTALFIWLGAAQEASALQVKSSLGDVPVSRAMMSQYETLSPLNSIKHVTDLIIAGSQQDFPVIDRERVVGVVTRGDVVKALAERGGQGFVSNIMRRDFQTMQANELLSAASDKLQMGGLHTMPVVNDGQLVGLLTLENIGEFLMIQSALNVAAQNRREAEAAI
jgi:Zn-dependent protease/predicted transcriptional regulator